MFYPTKTLEFILNFMNKLKVYDLLFAPYWKDRLEECATAVVIASQQNQEESSATMIPIMDDLIGTTWRLAYTNDFGMMPP